MQEDLEPFLFCLVGPMTFIFFSHLLSNYLLVAYYLPDTEKDMDQALFLRSSQPNDEAAGMGSDTLNLTFGEAFVPKRN